jgi:hypothetical protein
MSSKKSPDKAPEKPSSRKEDKQPRDKPQNPSPPKKEEKSKNEDSKNERKVSYIERAMLHFIKDKIMGGFDALKKPEILPFSIIALGVLFTNFILSISLAQLGNPVILQWLKIFLLVHLIIAVDFVVFGAIAAIWKKKAAQITIVCVGLVITLGLAIWFRVDSEWILFDIFRTIFLLVWILISTVSLFFMLLYLFTGMGGKMITAGKSPDHIFMDPILKFGAVITIFFSAALIFKNLSLNAYIIGGLGILTAFVVLYFTGIAPRDESHVNFATILGIYNLYIAYQMSGAIERADSVPNMLTEMILLIVVALYNIKNLTLRVESMDMEQMEQMNQFRAVFFQKKVNVFPRIKAKMGDFSLILIALGLSIGYFDFVIFSYISPTFPILSGFIDASLGLSVISRRLFSLVAISVFLLMCLVFMRSAKFREMVINKYNLKQAFRIAGDVVHAWYLRIKNKFQTRKEEKAKAELSKDDEDFVELVEK